jgi:hypothetical protein
MPLKKLTFDASVYKDDSPLDAEGYYVDSDKVRPKNGRMETIGGWETASNTTLQGIARTSMMHRDNIGNPFSVFGTHHRMYVMSSDGVVTDITPVASRGELSAPFGTSAGSAILSVTHAAHGLVDNQAVNFPNILSVNGATVSGRYAVTVTNANSYTFSASSAATSTGSSAGGQVDYEYGLAPGQADGLAGFGYGTGGYGLGGYGSPSTGLVYYPRTVSLAPWGQNTLLNPRGGGIYEFAPNTSASELVTNGDFSAATGWSAGANWSIGAGRAVAATASANLVQSVTLKQGAWHLLDCDVSVTSGTVTPYWGTTAIGSTMATGTIKREFYCGPGGAQDLKFTGSSFVGTVDNVSVKVLTVAARVTNAPTQVTAMFVTAERIVVALGAADANGNFDPLLVKWSDQQNNQTWTDDPANLARSYPLSNGSRIVGGIVANGENLVFTDAAVYLMRYTGDPDSVYRFDQIGNIGLLGPNSIALLGGIVYWVSPQVALYQYAGGAPVQIVSNVMRDVRENLSWSQQDKAFLSTNKANNEVWLHYPDARDGNEVSRYLIHNVTTGKESVGTFNRTTWVDAGVLQFPLAVSSSGSVYYQEKGEDDGGAARTWSMTSARFDLDDGDRHMSIMALEPDHDDLMGGYSVTVKTFHRDVKGETERTYGPFNVTNSNRRIPVRAVGQQAQLIWSGTDAPAWFRMGAFKLDVKPSGRRR